VNSKRTAAIVKYFCMYIPMGKEFPGVVDHYSHGKEISCCYWVLYPHEKTIPWWSCPFHVPVIQHPCLQISMVRDY